MKQNSIALACVLSGLLAGAQMADAFTADNPYVGAITNRNLFSLKPPPDPATLNPPPPAPPLPNVLLAGITTLMGNPRACLRVPRAARPPEPAKEVSVFLAAGAPAEEGVRVLEINVAAGLVKIDNNGTVQDLDISKNAPKSAAAPPPAAGGAPPPPPVPSGAIPVPRSPPAPPAVTGISRPIRDSGSRDSLASVIGSGQSQVKAEAPIPSPEEQTIMMEVWREQERAKVAAGLIKHEDMLPYPPTELSEDIPSGNSSGSDGVPQLPQ